MRSSWILRLTLSTFIIACGDATSQLPLVVVDAGGDSTEGGIVPPPPDDPSAPTFLSFGSDTQRLTQGQSVTITAVVTDPDGIEDVIGGTLVSENGLIHYGAFATGSQEGSYALALSWEKIDQAETIEFVSETSRIFVAEFFDQAGHRSRRKLELVLHCKGQAACTGQCTDLANSSTHCGNCGNDVSPLVCRESKAACENTSLTPCDGKCVSLYSDDRNCGSCGNDCLALTAKIQLESLICLDNKCTLSTAKVPPPTGSQSCAQICASIGQQAGFQGSCVPECTVQSGGGILFYPDTSWSSTDPWHYDRTSLYVYGQQNAFEVTSEQNCSHIPPAQRSFNGQSYALQLTSCCCTAIP